jgi:hypothetical protein
MSVLFIEGHPCASGARLLSVHGKKAQICVAGRTQHVLETGSAPFTFASMITMFRNIRGEVYGFTTDEVIAATLGS